MCEPLSLGNLICRKCKLLDCGWPMCGAVRTIWCVFLSEIWARAQKRRIAVARVSWTPGHGSRLVIIEYQHADEVQSQDTPGTSASKLL